MFNNVLRHIAKVDMTVVVKRLEISEGVDIGLGLLDLQG